MRVFENVVSCLMAQQISGGIGCCSTAVLRMVSKHHANMSTGPPKQLLTHLTLN